MITVVGGVYDEKCIEPFWDEVFGSGGRAAAAIAANHPVTLVTYRPRSLRSGLSNLERGFRVSIRGPLIDDATSFEYMHSLAVPRITPRPDAIAVHDPLTVTDDVVLRFGMLEGDAVVHAKIAIYDPQSAFKPTNFCANGSTANELALVLNRSEAQVLSGKEDLNEALKHLIATQGAAVVVIKMGSHGALVAHGDQRHEVPAYRSERVFKIGSGDIFSAAFAQFWGIERLGPAEAADLASRAAANYVASRAVGLPDANYLRNFDLVPISPRTGQIYIASPFFDIGQRWVVEEVRNLLLAAGVAVFSPLHDVGLGSGVDVAPLDLVGLDESNAVLAILSGADVGTVFEVGYAVAKGLPVVALAQNMRPEDLKMVEGTNCVIVGDLVSAVYQVTWAL